MCKEHEDGEKTIEAAGLNERVVMLPPYVEPEHRHIIDMAESTLEEYEQLLFSKIKNTLFEHGWNIDPHPSDIRKAELEFHNDEMRQHLAKQLMNIKLLCERPRFLIKGT